MKIYELIQESPLDTVGTTVGKPTGQAAFSVGKLAGRAGAALSGSKADVVDKDRSANVGRSVAKGIKGGIMQWATGKNDAVADLGKDQNIDLVNNIIAGREVVKAELQELIRELPTLKISWKVDRDAVAQALARADKGENLNINDTNALKALVKDLKKV